MGTTVAIRFPLGQYHGTPWDRSANEGASEWPPSPWRLLRALVATWYTRWPDLPAPVLDELLEALGDPPSYWTPPARPGHTRHYLPDVDHKQGETGGTDLTLDSFLSVSRDQELLVRWEADLPGEQREVLAKLLELTPYLGRAESVCEARLADDREPDENWWRPGAPGARQARLLAPSRPVSRPALEVTTVGVRKARRTMPLSTVWVSYGAGAQPARARTARRRAAAVQAVRFEVSGRVPVTAGNGVLLADEAHRVAGKALERAGIAEDRRRLIMGTGGAATGHRHAHWIPVADGGQPSSAVQALVVWAQEGLEADEVAALLSMRSLSGQRGPDGEGYQLRGLPKVELLFQAAGRADQVAPELAGPSRRWRSRTPYLPVRHRKREDLAAYLAADVTAELGYRERQPAVAIELTDELTDRWAHGYRRYRVNERLRDGRPGFGVALEFAEPVGGPLLLGQLSHFGYGIFKPE